MNTVATSKVSYIKLGPGGAWAERAIADGEMPLDFQTVPHELAARRDLDALRAHFISEGRDAGAAADFARQVGLFYADEPSRLWITFHAGKLWWASADPVVEWRGPGSDYGVRVRRTLAPWSCHDMLGHDLALHTLSSAITKTRSYQGTICSFDDAAAIAIVRRINGAGGIEAVAARAASAAYATALGEAITKLDQDDFEILVELIFNGLGWRRISELGGVQKHTDLIVQQPLTGEIAGVQVKSRAGARTIKACFDDLRAHGFERSIVACHSPSDEIAKSPDCELFDRPRLAQLAIQAGLGDWIIAHAL